MDPGGPTQCPGQGHQPHPTATPDHPHPPDPTATQGSADLRPGDRTRPPGQADPPRPTASQPSAGRRTQRPCATRRANTGAAGRCGPTPGSRITAPARALARRPARGNRSGLPSRATAAPAAGARAPRTHQCTAPQQGYNGGQGRPPAPQFPSSPAPPRRIRCRPGVPAATGSAGRAAYVRGPWLLCSRRSGHGNPPPGRVAGWLSSRRAAAVRSPTRLARRPAGQRPRSGTAGCGHAWRSGSCGSSGLESGHAIRSGPSKTPRRSGKRPRDPGSGRKGGRRHAGGHLVDVGTARQDGGIPLENFPSWGSGDRSRCGRRPPSQRHPRLFSRRGQRPRPAAPGTRPRPATGHPPTRGRLPGQIGRSPSPESRPPGRARLKVGRCAPRGKCLRSSPSWSRWAPSPELLEIALHGGRFFIFRENGAGASETGLTDSQFPGHPGAPAPPSRQVTALDKQTCEASPGGAVLTRQSPDDWKGKRRQEK